MHNSVYALIRHHKTIRNMFDSASTRYVFVASDASSVLCHLCFKLHTLEISGIGGTGCTVCFLRRCNKTMSQAIVQYLFPGKVANVKPGHSARHCYRCRPPSSAVLQQPKVGDRSHRDFS